MNLYIRQKIFSFGDKYNVFNEQEQPVFTVHGEIFTFGAKIHVCDLAGNELYYIQQKLFRFLPEYHIFNGENLCAVIKKELSFFKPRLFIQSQFGDFNIEGNLFGMDFEIRNGDLPVGEIHKKWLSFGDTYELIVHNPDDAAFFSTMVIAIDNCLHNENKH